MSSDVALESPVARATPMSSSRRGLEAPRTTDSRQPRKATAADPAKASSGRATAEGKIPAGTKTMKAATSSPAPALMPSTPGSAMSLRETPCRRHPERDSPTPTRSEVSTRGRRRSTRV